MCFSIINSTFALSNGIAYIVGYNGAFTTQALFDLYYSGMRFNAGNKARVSGALDVRSRCNFSRRSQGTF